MSKPDEDEDFNPNLLSPEELKAWEEQQDHHALREHLSWLSELDSLGTLKDLNTEDARDQVADLVMESRNDIYHTTGNQAGRDEWEAETGKRNVARRTVNAANAAALKGIKSFAAAVAALARLNPNLRSAAKKCIKRCELARRAMTYVDLPMLPEPPRSSKRFRKVPGLEKRLELAEQYHTSIENLLVALGIPRQDAEVRSLKIRNKYWGFKKKLKPYVDDFGNERAGARQKHNTRKRKQAATGPVRRGRPAGR